MDWLFLAASALILVFGFVVLFGAPYLPTLKKQVEAGLDLLDLEPGETLLELGCGDGRVLKAAARRNLKAVGYELNPLLALVARLYTWPQRKHIRVIWGNYWQADWPPAQGIFVFLLDKYMLKLDKKIAQDYSKPVKLVSHAFEIPNRQPDKQRAGFYRYDYRLSA